MLHPDYLLTSLSWSQFTDWQRAYTQEPWGDERQDQRTLALAAWIKAPATWSGELPELLYPYFQTGEDLLAQKAILDTRAEEIKAKWKAQRERDILGG